MMAPVHISSCFCVKIIHSPFFPSKFLLVIWNFAEIRKGCRKKLPPTRSPTKGCRFAETPVWVLHSHKLVYRLTHADQTKHCRLWYALNLKVSRNFHLWVVVTQLAFEAGKKSEHVDIFHAINVQPKFWFNLCRSYAFLFRANECSKSFPERPNSVFAMKTKQCQKCFCFCTVFCLSHGKFWNSHNSIKLFSCHAFMEFAYSGEPKPSWFCWNYEVWQRCQACFPVERSRKPVLTCDNVFMTSIRWSSYWNFKPTRQKYGFLPTYSISGWFSCSWSGIPGLGMGYDMFCTNGSKVPEHEQNIANKALPFSCCFSVFLCLQLCSFVENNCQNDSDKSIRDWKERLLRICIDTLQKASKGGVPEEKFLTCLITVGNLILVSFILRLSQFVEPVEPIRCARV